jgi:hypothetical protein
MSPSELALVARLVSYGEPDSKSGEWEDYLADGGLTQTDVPALIAIATSESLSLTDSDIGWTPIHAWRALGQLRAIEAVKPLIPLFAWDWDWVWEDLPAAYALMGTAVLPVLAECIVPLLTDEDSGITSIVETLTKIAAVSDEARTAAVGTLGELLSHYETSDRLVNGALVCVAIDLKAVEYVELVEAMYAANRVNTIYSGSWASVQVDLGLRDRGEFKPSDLDPLYEDLVPFQQFMQEQVRLTKAPDTFFTAAQPKQRDVSGFGNASKPDLSKSSKKKPKKR